MSAEPLCKKERTEKHEERQEKDNCTSVVCRRLHPILWGCSVNQSPFPVDVEPGALSSSLVLGPTSCVASANHSTSWGSVSLNGDNTPLIMTFEDKVNVWVFTWLV